MSPLWLILIVPAVFMAGYITGGILITSAQSDQCTRCKYGEPFQDKETQK